MAKSFREYLESSTYQKKRFLDTNNDGEPIFESAPRNINDFVQRMEKFGNKHRKENIGMHIILGNGNSIYFHFAPMYLTAIRVDGEKLTLETFYNEYLDYSGIGDIYLVDPLTGKDVPSNI